LYSQLLITSISASHIVSKKQWSHTPCCITYLARDKCIPFLIHRMYDPPLDLISKWTLRVVGTGARADMKQSHCRRGVTCDVMATPRFRVQLNNYLYIKYNFVFSLNFGFKFLPHLNRILYLKFSHTALNRGVRVLIAKERRDKKCQLLMAGDLPNAMPSRATVLVGQLRRFRAPCAASASTFGSKLKAKTLCSRHGPLIKEQDKGSHNASVETSNRT
jgi:hypothetical protein